MRVRKLDANLDMTFGNGGNDFYVDQPEAPAQCCMTRMALWQGQWFLDSNAGTPWQTKVLGKYTGSIRDVALQQRALGTQGVNAITAYSSSVDRNTRAFSVNINLDTIYGRATVAGPI